MYFKIQKQPCKHFWEFSEYGANTTSTLSPLPENTQNPKSIWNSVQLLAKWSEKEHDKQPTNPETAPSDIEQDSYTNKLYNYVNNANNKA